LSKTLIKTKQWTGASKTEKTTSKIAVYLDKMKNPVKVDLFHETEPQIKFFMQEARYKGPFHEWIYV